MPVIDCDPEVARKRLEAEGMDIQPGNTDHERWRTSYADATAVAYDDKVVVQGGQSARLVGVIEGGGGRAHIYFDGASRGNPGPAAIGWVIVTSDGIAAEGNETIGTATNNQAEYEALIAALEAAADFGFEEVRVKGDSELIVKQVRGEWDTNDPTLREKRIRVRQLLDRFEQWSIDHVPRGINERADKLANEALDG